MLTRLGVIDEKKSLPFISSLLDSCVPSKRSNHNMGKRKRGQLNDSTYEHHPLIPPTELNELVLEGMGNDQIWSQLELRSAKIARVLDHVITSTANLEEEDDEDEESSSDDDSLEYARENDANVEWDEDEDDESDHGFAGASDLSDVDPNEVFYEPLHTEEMQLKRREEKERQEMMQIYGVSDPALYEALLPNKSNDQGTDDDEEEEEEEEDHDSPTFFSKPRHPTLDDDFFSIDEFNRLTEAEERKNLTSRANLSGDEDESDSDNIDLYAPIEEQDEGDDNDTPVEDIHYTDFFDPPPVSAVKKSNNSSRSSHVENKPPAPPRKSLVRFHDQVRVRPIKKCKPQSSAGLLTDGTEEEEEEEDENSESDAEDTESGEEEEDESSESDTEDTGSEEEEEEDDDRIDDEEDEEMEGEDRVNEESMEDESMDNESDNEARIDDTANRVAQDLFDDESDKNETSMSTHERRVAELAKEIAQYEDENVQKKDWVLMGEASTRERPTNSLLEEDLEFERTAKSAPVQTQEHGEGIESMIKRRILERQFDDVIRQRDLDAVPFSASRVLELSDARSSKSLAELYEEEYQASRGEEAGESAPRSEAETKLDNEHSAIAADMDALFSKLDALSNAHYTPKAPKAAIQTLSNTPAVAIESALPTTMSAGTMLAPEEVYERPSHSVALEGAKSELSHAEKQKRHHQLRREKRQRNDRIKRTEAAIERQRGGPRKGDVKTEKDKALKSLVGNKGVTVVGKDSKRHDVKRPKSDQSASSSKSSSASQWKL